MIHELLSVRRQHDSTYSTPTLYRVASVPLGAIHASLWEFADRGREKTHICKAEDGRSRYLQAAIQMTKFTFTRVAYLLQRNSPT